MSDARNTNRNEDAMDNHYGSKLDETKGLSTTEIAKLVRKDIKAAKKAGLPINKVSVRTQSFSGGSSITVEVKSLHPVAGPLFNVGAALDEMDGCNVHWGDQQSNLYKRITETLKGILGQYNWDNSDSMTDYFDVRFYAHVEFDYDLREVELELAKDRAAEVRAHEEKHEVGAGWVDAYYLAAGKREMAGYMVAEFTDAVKCLDATEYAEHLAKLEAKADEAVAEADEARKAWEVAIDKAMEADCDAEENPVVRVLSYEDVLAAAEPDEAPATVDATETRYLVRAWTPTDDSHGTSLTVVKTRAEAAAWIAEQLMAAAELGIDIATSIEARTAELGSFEYNGQTVSVESL